MALRKLSAPPRLKNLRLEDVRSFLELNVHTREATKTENLVNSVAWLQSSTTTYTVQSKLTQYFPSEPLQ